jgi:hypothetical protein
MKVVLLLIGFILCSIDFAEAQQPGNIPRIGSPLRDTSLE